MKSKTKRGVSPKTPLLLTSTFFASQGFAESSLLACLLCEPRSELSQSGMKT